MYTVVYTSHTEPCTCSSTRAVYTAAYTAVYGPCTRPVYTTRVHDCVRAVCTEVFGPSRPAYTAPYTGHVHGCVRAVHTAVYTTRIRPRTCVYVYKGRVHGRVRAIYSAENGRLHGRIQPCNVSCIRPCTGRIGSCTRQCTGHVHGRFRPCILPFLAVYIARTRPCNGPCTRPLHGHTRAVWAVYTAGRPTGPCTRSQTARCGRVRPVTAVYKARSQPVHGSLCGRVRRPLHGRPTRAYVYTAVKRPCTCKYTSVYTASTQSCT